MYVKIKLNKGSLSDAAINWQILTHQRFSVFNIILHQSRFFQKKQHAVELGEKFRKSAPERNSAPSDLKSYHTSAFKSNRFTKTERCQIRQNARSWGRCDTSIRALSTTCLSRSVFLIIEMYQ